VIVYPGKKIKKKEKEKVHSKGEKKTQTNEVQSFEGSASNTGGSIDSKGRLWSMPWPPLSSKPSYKLLYFLFFKNHEGFATVPHTKSLLPPKKLPENRRRR
jgi:hypothetical protein